MVPQPVHAVLCLLPLTPNVEARHRTEDAAYTRPQGAEDVLWFQQTVRRCTLTQIGNACGTIGLLHAIANSPAQEAIQTDSPLAQLLRVARGATPADRTKLLESSDALKSAHAATAGQGQTAAPGADEPVDLHFVAFVRGPDGKLWELDGRRRGPVARDVPVASQAALLPSAAQFVQDYYVCCAAAHADAHGPRPGAVQPDCARTGCIVYVDYGTSCRASARSSSCASLSVRRARSPSRAAACCRLSAAYDGVGASAASAACTCAARSTANVSHARLAAYAPAVAGSTVSVRGGRASSTLSRFSHASQRRGAGCWCSA